MMEIRIFSPENIIDNHQLEHGAWTAKKIFDKTGIQTRHISSSSDSALSLAVHAADRLFCDTKINRSVIESLIYCTQSPDYIIPNNVSILHDQLQLNSAVPAVEYNQGCTGYIYGLFLVKSFIASL